MKQSAFSISLSIFFLVLGVVSLFQGSNPKFISSADTVANATFDVSKLLIISGIVLIVLSAATAYIQYLIMVKKGK